MPKKAIRYDPEDIPFHLNGSSRTSPRLFSPERRITRNLQNTALAALGQVPDLKTPTEKFPPAFPPTTSAKKRKLEIDDSKWTRQDNIRMVKALKMFGRNAEKGASYVSTKSILAFQIHANEYLWAAHIRSKAHIPEKCRTLNMAVEWNGTPFAIHSHSEIAKMDKQIFENIGDFDGCFSESEHTTDEPEPEPEFCISPAGIPTPSGVGVGGGVGAECGGVGDLKSGTSPIGRQSKRLQEKHGTPNSLDDNLDQDFHARLCRLYKVAPIGNYEISESSPLPVDPPPTKKRKSKNSENKKPKKTEKKEKVVLKISSCDSPKKIEEENPTAPGKKEKSETKNENNKISTFPLSIPKPTDFNQSSRARVRYVKQENSDDKLRQERKSGKAEAAEAAPAEQKLRTSDLRQPPSPPPGKTPFMNCLKLARFRMKKRMKEKQQALASENSDKRVSSSLGHGFDQEEGHTHTTVIPDSDSENEKIKNENENFRIFAPSTPPDTGANSASSQPHDTKKKAPIVIELSGESEGEEEQISFGSPQASSFLGSSRNDPISLVSPPRQNIVAKSKKESPHTKQTDIRNFFTSPEKSPANLVHLELHEHKISSDEDSEEEGENNLSSSTQNDSKDNDRSVSGGSNTSTLTDMFENEEYPTNLDLNLEMCDL